MRLLEERSRGRLRVRVTDCGCDEGCEARAVFASTHPQLWVWALEALHEAYVAETPAVAHYAP